MRIERALSRCFAALGKQPYTPISEIALRVVNIMSARPGQPTVEIVQDAAAVLESIDERTLLVPISHVLFKTGEIPDVETIVRRAHEAGALVVLDAYQSVGTLPLAVAALHVDFSWESSR